MTGSQTIGDDAQLEDGVYRRIIFEAARLIALGGIDAATTRAVATAAAVQAPTIYRLFGDKRGLLDAVAEQGLRAYVQEKGMREPHPDPVQDLREGWDIHVEFGLAHPDLFLIMAGKPYPHADSPASLAGMEILRRRVRAIARAERLRVSEDRAIALVHSVGTGTILTLLRQPENERDHGLSAFAREAVMTAITSEATGRSNPTPRVAAATLRASLAETSAITNGERHLMIELLDRIANDEQT